MANFGENTGSEDLAPVSVKLKVKLKVLYEMDWVGLALCLANDIGDRSSVHGVDRPVLNFGVDFFLPDVSPARLHELPF
jgi:hypothetical protein